MKGYHTGMIDISSRGLLERERDIKPSIKLRQGEKNERLISDRVWGITGLYNVPRLVHIDGVIMKELIINMNRRLSEQMERQTRLVKVVQIVYDITRYCKVIYNSLLEITDDRDKIEGGPWEKVIRMLIWIDIERLERC